VNVLTIDIGSIQLDPSEGAPQIDIDTFALENPGLVDANGVSATPVACFLVHESQHLTLIDTGVGQRQRHNLPRGTLDSKLQHAGIRPEDINLVVLTHLHDDHVGWNTVDDLSGRPKPYFEHAKYVVYTQEWDYWTHADRRSADGYEYLADCVLPLEDYDRLLLVPDERALTQSLTIVSTPGHTPGHIALGIDSRGERALLIGDVSHYIGQLNHPEWSPIWDWDQKLSAKTRSILFDKAEAQGSVLLPTHYPFPAAGRIVRVQGRRLFGPFAGARRTNVS
jgi:glyoxylase-like metal-dependent hydrolase (beta-lactamase superfamily II)